ncbi:beta subunit of N-acylethanolamine-hydrolyzing acid amidase-domain-containing protein [Nemania sp. NC0429]|nr:beta subunit of N-acylethanolamine-hydrolyzing acid amidase-domain-containing protein [Nemania sp. NC0429]KAI1109903.1 beta subunit of N-acylethanolamine-hydrolyzing acid amidase-domain-containing protein [Nemania sp. NC0429]
MSKPAMSEEDPIPRFTIDLARPPRERYDEVVRVFGARMRSLTGLFDSLLATFIASAWLRALVIGLCKVFLRRVYDDEENEEIRGVAAASGVPVYLLVALNSLLDCLLGCTSGAVPVSFGEMPIPRYRHNARGAGSGLYLTRLMHFRTLDWGMDELRDLLVELEFVDSSAHPSERLVGRSITYAGYVGCLTAVRRGLSISLNHRACHDCPSRYLYWHQLMVLLGKRRSISSTLRSFLLQPLNQVDEVGDAADSSTTSLIKRATALTLVPSAPCYLILCDGKEAAVIVKDYITGTVRSAREFIAQTNHDPNDGEKDATRQHETVFRQDRREVMTSAFKIEGWVEESTERLQCIQKKWDRLMQSRSKAENLRPKRSITEKTLQKWISDYPTLNECSHFATILDPETGRISWLVRGPFEDPEG